jgi:hypothetical protein
VNVTNSS